MQNWLSEISPPSSLTLDCLKTCRFYVFRILVDILDFSFTQIFLFTWVGYQVSKNKGWSMTLLLSGVLSVHNNRDLYFLCYYKLPPARCFLVLLWSLKEGSFKASIAVQRYPHLKVYFFHVVWYFYASLSQKRSLFSYVMHCALITYFIVNIIETPEKIVYIHIRHTQEL